jgi:hypothetical protein
MDGQDLAPGDPRRSLEQQPQELPPGEPQQEHAGGPEQQTRVPRGRSPAGAMDSAPDWTGRPPVPVETPRPGRANDDPGRPVLVAIAKARGRPLLDERVARGGIERSTTDDDVSRISRRSDRIGSDGHRLVGRPVLDGSVGSVRDRPDRDGRGPAGPVARDRETHHRPTEKRPGISPGGRASRRAMGAARTEPRPSRMPRRPTGSLETNSSLGDDEATPIRPPPGPIRSMRAGRIGRRDGEGRAQDRPYRHGTSVPSPDESPRSTGGAGAWPPGVALLLSRRCQ